MQTDGKAPESDVAASDASAPDVASSAPDVASKVVPHDGDPAANTTPKPTRRTLHANSFIEHLGYSMLASVCEGTVHCQRTEGSGGAEGNRTPDLFHAMEALSQLSYGPRNLGRQCLPESMGSVLHIFPRDTAQTGPAQNLIPFSARCFHQRHPSHAVGNAATAARGKLTATPNATVVAVATPAITPFVRDSASTSRRVAMDSTCRGTVVCASVTDVTERVIPVPSTVATSRVDRSPLRTSVHQNAACGPSTRRTELVHNT